MTFDPACEDLAEMFLDDPPVRKRLIDDGYSLSEIDDLRRRLALTIQGAIEDWFVGLDDEIETTRGRRAAHQGEEDGHPDDHR
jgi:hypothetical protein